MITDIPTSDEFKESGLSLLNFSWDITIKLLTDLDEAYSFEHGHRIHNKLYWNAAKQELTTAIAIAQQGTEFLLKSRIAAVSPFLLISDKRRGWPKSSDKNDTSFAEFRTIDAQDLIYVHDSVAETPLPNEFVIRFNELRIRRNAIMHTVDKRLKLQISDVISDILSVYKHLFPEGNWVKIRRDFLIKSPLAKLHSYDYVQPQVVLEFSLISNLLSPSKMREFFNFNKRQRKYLCPECSYQGKYWLLEPRTALLKPNTLTSTKVYCFICDLDSEVERWECTNDDCDGNVIESGKCLTCGFSVY